jgi:hypothetical protein
MFHKTSVSGDIFYFFFLEILNIKDDPLGDVEETFHFTVQYLR